MAREKKSARKRVARVIEIDLEGRRFLGPAYGPNGDLGLSGNELRQLQALGVIEKPTGSKYDFSTHSIVSWDANNTTSTLPASTAQSQPTAVPQTSLQPKPPKTPQPPPAASTPAPALTSNTVLSAEQARSLQDSYPGIQADWTIDQYEQVVQKFYEYYAKWGGDREPTSADLQAFLASGKMPF